MDERKKKKEREEERKRKKKEKEEKDKTKKEENIIKKERKDYTRFEVKRAGPSVCRISSSCSRPDWYRPFFKCRLPRIV